MISKWEVIDTHLDRIFMEYHCSACDKDLVHTKLLQYLKCHSPDMCSDAPPPEVAHAAETSVEKDSEQSGAASVSADAAVLSPTSVSGQFDGDVFSSYLPPHIRVRALDRLQHLAVINSSVNLSPDAPLRFCDLQRRYLNRPAVCVSSKAMRAVSVGCA